MFKNIIFIPLIIFSIGSAYAGGGYLEIREAWNSASEEHQLKLGVGYNFDNGAGALYQSAFNTGKNWNQLKHSFDEIEGWYPIWNINESTTFFIGGLVNTTKEGSTTSPYFHIAYKANKDLVLVTKYKYNHMNYETLNLYGEMDYNDSHQLILVANYKITDTLAYEFEPNLYINTADYNRKNKKDHSWELNHKFTWKMTQQWRPFIQVSWLDRDTKNHAEQIRIRLGIRYYF
ncbi:porin OmpL [Citrobacter freundii]|jgi:predicted porin|uniref:oligogalacturonate-specific porin KdgM family protein n=1 Tax=Citrobacter TaxID=544 RepID=UPI00129C2B98|nr:MULTISPECIES: oligogalacturonate-specific porin KdgM family protein [Citrobacter]MBA8199448.1 porin OmpL [Citrobacter freundii]MCS3464148.1 putative porin [Citrobacter sp. JUb117]QMF23748.1 porin OmpL [Citrobacter freundii]